MFNDWNICQNLIGFIFAGTETTHYTAQVLTSILTQKPEILDKVRKEYISHILEPAAGEDPSVRDLPLNEQLNKTLSLLSVSELEYGPMVI